MPWYLALPVTALIILASAFFVVIEFSLMAARRNRLEETAGTSRASRAALRGMNELTVMLAGAQLGITAATFALGAVAKPAVQRLLAPVLEALSLPDVAVSAVAFAVALFLVTFLHLVVGEMAPKSWALAHPERAARLVALPASGYISVFRPLLVWINKIANRLVARTGVEPVHRAAAQGYDPDTLRNLIEHSTKAGTLDDASASQMSRIIRFDSTTVGELVASHTRPAGALAQDATVEEVQREARESGHFRILLRPGVAGETWRPLGVVHVRDTLLVDPSTPAVDFAREVLQLQESTTLQGAVERMRAARTQLAVVVPDDGDARIVGVLTSEDLLDQIWPSIEEGLGRGQS